MAMGLADPYVNLLSTTGLEQAKGEGKIDTHKNHARYWMSIWTNPQLLIPILSFVLLIVVVNHVLAFLLED